MKRLLMFITVLGLAFMLVACGSDKIKNDQPADEPTSQEVVFGDEEKVNGDKVVANINGVEVMGDTYNLMYVQTKIRLQRSGQDVSDLDAVKDLVVNALIDQEVLRQDAMKAGIDVSDDEVDTEFAAIKSENEEQLLAFIDTYYLTEAAFKDQLIFAIMYEKYITSEISIDEVTDQEIKDFYGEQKAINPDIQKIDEIEAELKQVLKEQKQEESLWKKLEGLKKEATIEKLI